MSTPSEQEGAQGWQLCPAGLSTTSFAGDGSALVRMLQEGSCRLEEIGSYDKEDLQHLLRQCAIPFGAEDSKVRGSATAYLRGYGEELVEQDGAAVGRPGESCASGVSL